MSNEAVTEVPTELMNQLTVVLADDEGFLQADADVAALAEGKSTIIRSTCSETYFHQLRLLISRDPELERKITVAYLRKDGTFVRVGLTRPSEDYWPAGFMNKQWEQETELQKNRIRKIDPSASGYRRLNINGTQHVSAQGEQMKLSELNPIIGMVEYAGGVNVISLDCPVCGPPFRCSFLAKLNGQPDQSLGLWRWTGCEPPYSWDQITVFPSIDFSRTSAHGKNNICKVHFSITNGEVTVS